MDLSSSLPLVDLKLSVANKHPMRNFLLIAFQSPLPGDCALGSFTFFDSESGINSLWQKTRIRHTLSNRQRHYF